MIITKDARRRAVDLSTIPTVVLNSIGGEEGPAADGRTFAKVNPATGQEICRVARSGAADVSRAGR